MNPFQQKNHIKFWCISTDVTFTGTQELSQELRILKRELLMN